MAHHRVQDLAEKPTGGEPSQAAAAASARETLLHMLSTNDVIGASSQVIDMLRTSEYDISDLFRDSNLVKRDAKPEEVALVDELLERCISRTALVHERAIESMLHGYCEIGLDGRILYANPSFLNLVPDAVGQSLFDLFSEIAEPTDFAHDTADIRRFELLTASGSRSLVVERGPLGLPNVAAYAMVADLTDREEAKRQVHEKAQFGILRLDPNRVITYANPVACELLHSTSDKLVGRNSADFVLDADNEHKLAPHLRLRERGVSTEYELTIAPEGNTDPLTVRVRTMPETGPSGEISGALVTLAPIETELAAEQIQNVMATSSSPNELFDRVVEIVRRVVQFDYALLSLSTKDKAFSRRLIAVPDDLVIDARWIPIPAGLRRTDERLYGHCLSDTMLSTQDGKKLLRHAAVQEFIDKGLHAWVAHRIIGDEFDGTFTLLSKTAGAYDGQTSEKLDRIGVGNAMQTVLRLLKDQDEQFQLALVKELAQKATDVELAELVVKRFSAYYGWKNVSIFKVNRFQKKISLLCQAAAEKGGFRLPEGHSQNLDQGMLGECVLTERPILIADTDDPAVRDKLVRASEHTRAELCVPIRVRDRIVWVLNIEDRRPYAFTDADLRIVENLMKGLEAPLERALSAALLNQVLDDTPDAIIITDSNNCILRSNVSAREMLGGAHRSESLSQFVVDGEGAEALSSLVDIKYPLDATVRGSDGTCTDVRVRACIPHAEYDRRIVILQDRAQFNWHEGAGRLIEALASLASEVRVPLALASTFLNEIRRLEPEVSTIAALAEQALEQLSHVDLSYDKVVQHDSAGQRQKTGILKSLKCVISRLPPADQKLVVLNSVEVEPIILERGALESALGSMFAYLLRIGEDQAPIRIRLSSTDSQVLLVMERRRQQENSREPDPLSSSSLDEAQALAGLNEPRILNFARGCGGYFRRREAHDDEILSLTLRSAAG